MTAGIWLKRNGSTIRTYQSLELTTTMKMTHPLIYSSSQLKLIAKLINLLQCRVWQFYKNNSFGVATTTANLNSLTSQIPFSSLVNNHHLLIVNELLINIVPPKRGVQWWNKPCMYLNMCIDIDIFRNWLPTVGMLQKWTQWCCAWLCSSCGMSVSVHLMYMKQVKYHTTSA